MPRKSPHDLKPGMQLAAEARNLDGSLLFPNGQVLDEARIEILMMWGVESVTVNGSEDPAEGLDIDCFSQKAHQRAASEVQRRFQLVKSAHPAVETIRKIAILETARASQAGPSLS